MSIDIQSDFNNYFEMVKTKAVNSKFYTDIQAQFEEGKIDARTYASIITSFHADTLKEAIAIGRDMAIGVRELELKVNESVASVALSNRRVESIGEENYLKSQEVISLVALNNKKIEDYNWQYTLAQARENREISLNNKRIEVEEARRLLLARQKTGFDDNLRIKRAEHSSALYGSIEMGGNEAPDDLVSFTMEKLGAI